MSKIDCQLIQDEVYNTRQLMHSNIIPYITSFLEKSQLYVVFPLMGYGSCRDLLRNHFIEGLPETVIAFILRDVILGLEYIHNKGLIHRAIKASHILIRADGHACLSGLRNICSIDKRSNLHSLPLQSANNLNWFSPEMLEQNLLGYNEKSDIYSLGITACELANGFVPFAETDTTLMLTQKVKGLIPHLLDCTTCYPYEDNGYQSEEAIGIDSNPVSSVYTRMFSESFHNLVEQCCQKVSDTRPSATELLAHNFTKQVKKFNFKVTDLLRPAVPLLKSNVTEISDDLASVSGISQQLSDLDLLAYSWDFDYTEVASENY
ncbi:STE20-related kinase adapter protein alpha isoform X2 [Daktulosphaira vitifoliae]|nr:STE20-related kinase adapter protein alpha isoform X2 [Daktulosphaira vitifoliae]XP_050519765.1 STE20-related kinase adapter protein alpha isoform X2 [Daktulosphaira vitifoliae]